MSFIMKLFARMNLFGLMFFLFLCVKQTEIKAQTSIPYRWNTVPIGGGGFVSGIITSKTQRNLIYARTDVGGAYCLDSVSNKWVPLLDWVSDNELGYLGVESLASDPGNPANLYMLVGTSYFNNGKTAILRSTNYGKTFSVTDVTSQFKAHGNGEGRNTGEKLAVDPKNGSILYCGSRNNGLFKSTDAGVSWSHLTSLDVTTTPCGNGINFVILDPAGSGASTQILIVGISRLGTTNLYRSDDAGASFSAISGAPATLMPERAVLANDRNLYIAYAEKVGPWGPRTGQIQKYNIATGVWTNITPAGITLPFCGISVDPKNPNRIIASTTNTYLPQGTAFGDRFFLTTNGGSSWTDIVSRGYGLDPNGITWMDKNQSIHWAGCIEFDPFNTRKVFVNSGNGLFVTDNIDAVPAIWKFSVNGLEETVPLDVVSIPNGPFISVVGDYDGFTNKNIAQYGPQLKPTMGTTTGLAYSALNTSVVVRVGEKMYYSKDTGQSWTQCTTNGKYGHVSISADGKTFLHSPAGSTITYRSANDGNSWSPVSGLNFSDERTVADPVNSNKFYAYDHNSGVMWVSANGGLSFSAAGSPGGSGSRHIRTVLGYEGHIWVALYEGGLTRSVNSGQAFTKISNVSSCSAVGIGKKAPQATYPTIYIWGTVNGVTGIYRSTNEGASWVRINDDLHQYGGPANGQFVIGDMNVFGRVYMSTAGLGIVYGDILSN
jgi:photosystem II stability/assembly factor-like uncharacterized protein